MGKVKITAESVHPNAPIYQVVGEPTFPGRDILKYDVKREFTTSIEVNNDRGTVRLNGEYTISLNGTMNKIAETVHLDEEVAIEVLGIKAQEADKLADQALKDAEEMLKRAKQDKEVTAGVVKRVKELAVKGSLDFDKKGQDKELTL